MNRVPERATRREIERRLAETPAGEPPAELASRLKAEVPDRLELAPRAPAGAGGRRRTPGWLAAAAAVVVAVGGAWMLWRLSDQAVPAAREAWVAGEGAGAPDGIDDGVGEERAELEAPGYRGSARPDRPEASRVRQSPGERIDAEGLWAGAPSTGADAGTASATRPSEAIGRFESEADDRSRSAAFETAVPQEPRIGEAGAPPHGGAFEDGGTHARRPVAERAAPRGRRDAATASGAVSPRASRDELRRPAGAPAAPEAAPPPPPAEERRAAALAAGAETSETPPLSLPPVGFDHAQAARQGRLVLPAPPPPSASMPAASSVPAYARLAITLRVLVLAGEVPWTGAEVTLVLPDGSTRRAVADPQGFAVFSDLEPGDYRLAARAEPGAPARAVPLSLPPDRSGVLDAMLQLVPAERRPAPGPGAGTIGAAGANVVVRVVDESRQPLPGVTLAFDVGGRVVHRATGADGRAALRLPPGRHRVRASLEGFGAVSQDFEARGGSHPSAVELALPLAAVAEEIVVTGTVAGGSALRVVGEPVNVVGEAPKSAPRHSTAAAVGGTGAGLTSRRGPAPPAPPAVHDRIEGPLRVGPESPDDGSPRDMFFRHWGVHPFVDTAGDALSTFGLDVDTGSWGLVASYLERGLLPPPEAVRVEEMVNALDYGDPPPGAGETFRVAVDGAPTPFAPGPDHRLLRFGLRARSIDPAQRRPATLVFVVDASGSMKQGGRLELVKEALGMLLDQLGEDDRVAVVAFSDDARVVLPPTADRGAARRAIAGLAPNGSTNAEAGLALGYRVAWEARRPGTVRRVLLLSDGVANVGSTTAESILARAAGAAADGIELSTFGVGMGNYDDVLLEQLADRGDGRYAYVDDAEAAHRLFVAELAGTLETVAEEARVQVAFDPRSVVRWRLLGYENREIADDRFRHDHSVDAGEIGAGHTVTALYEVRLAPGVAPSTPIAHLTLRYREPGGGRFREVERMVVAGELAASWEGAPASLRLAAVAAEVAEQLRGVEFAAEGDLAVVAREMGRAGGDGRARELVEMVGRVVELRKE